MTDSPATAQTVLIAAPPTPNGDLHVGHMAGPYLAADVYARYLRAHGRPVTYALFTDNSQTYVVSTAHRRGVSPEQLCAESASAIEHSLDAMGISVDGLAPVDENYRAAVLDFITALHRAGRFRLRTVALPFVERAGEFLADGLVCGDCPVCLAPSCGGSCEDCGHPNTFADLRNPRSTRYPDEAVVLREATILVLPLEEYRERLTAYFAAREGDLRPHGRQLIRELLAGPLPDVPVTFPTGWGIPAPFPQTPGQVLYPWIEALPASLYSAQWAARRRGASPAEVDSLWRSGARTELVYFHGYDNVYFWALVNLAMLMAHDGGCPEPRLNVCNEFYELDHEKFSTSRNHLIRGADLVAEHPRDVVRFYLALTCPEHQRINFSRDAMRLVTAQRLVEPWNALADALDRAVGNLAMAGAVPTSKAGRQRAAAMAQRFRYAYELPAFSLSRAADTIVAQLARLRVTAESLAATAVPEQTGDLLLEVRTLLAGCAPILIDTAEQARVDGVPPGLAAGDDRSVAPLRLPRLGSPVTAGDRAPALAAATT